MGGGGGIEVGEDGRWTEGTFRHHQDDEDGHAWMMLTHSHRPPRSLTLAN